MVKKRSLFGDAVVHNNYVHLNINLNINRMPDYVVQDIEDLLAKAIQQSSIQADKQSWSEPDQYMATWGTEAWRGDIASIFAEGGNLKISATFSGAEKFMEEINKRYNIFPY